jgi:hypothetical protein
MYNIITDIITTNPHYIMYTMVAVALGAYLRS